MINNELTTILNHLAVAAYSNLMYDDIEVVEITTTKCVEQTSVPDESAEVVLNSQQTDMEKNHG